MLRFFSRRKIRLQFFAEWVQNRCSLCGASLAQRTWKESKEMQIRMRRGAIFAAAIAGLAFCVPFAAAQSAAGSGTSTSTPSTPQSPSAAPAAQTNSSPWHTQPGVAYHRPTDKQKFHAYLFDTFGPYPFLGATVASAISQSKNSPPEWQQGYGAYGVRFASAYGIAMITTTTRYGLAEALHEDTLYYRCSCSGFLPRLEHSLISTFTARRGEDGHQVLSLPAIAAPYAGTMIAVAGWYPDRYGVKDGFRMGNYALLYVVGNNLALEFLYGGPHTLLPHVPLISHTSHEKDSDTNP